MREIPQNTMFWLFGFGPKAHAIMAFVVNLLAIATTIIGIVSGARKSPIGLETTHWFLLAIILFVWGISFWFSAYFGAKEGYTK